MKSEFEKLDYLITPMILVIVITKTIIFDDNIDIGRKLTIYLQYQLFAGLHHKTNLLI